MKDLSCTGVKHFDINCTQIVGLTYITIILPSSNEDI